jgi:hypothetical protein
VHLPYDRMASLLAFYGSAEAVRVFPLDQERQAHEWGMQSHLRGKVVLQAAPQP